MRLNGAYYITKQILPALDRALSILGIDVFKWYNELPKVHRIQSVAKGLNRKGTIGQYFSSLHCPLCDKVSADEICPDCSKNPQVVAISLSSRIHSARTNHADLCQVRESCGCHGYWLAPPSSCVRTVAVKVVRSIIWSAVRWIVLLCILVRPV